MYLDPIFAQSGNFRLRPKFLLSEITSLSFYARKRVLLSARLSHCNSVCLSHRWISQKWCKLGLRNLYCRLPGKLVSRTVKLFH